MKTILSLIAVACVALTSFAQIPTPEPPAVPVPVQPTPAAVLAQLKAIRDQNARLIEQQAATLKQLEEMEKTAQTLKMMGKRS